VSASALARHRATKILWLSYPAIVFFVIVATGNHYWLDAVAGALVAGVALIAAVQLARLRPAAWSWSEATERAAA
jgi:hypothetical protein